ncbi:rhodanese-like domain-containing protein [Vibrio sp. MACH09]|uniref:rhodanese-like domain-containing protein n=1 Tax=unclassified Vibrio TaxID=2614977 RepID=UPI001493DAE2|nr:MULTISPECIES: rhodanese-like domain-containing protein [unclassified Vibrio]NOI68642.1 rhodanese-like domain-containing protein [Vibrio sp. 99-8-1]GLO59671.1 rhodanese-like domain-containing protein [Vibrio sp. MACH09]
MQEYIDFIQNNMILALVWAGLVVAIVMSFIKSATAAYKEVSPAELTQFINKDEGVVVDIRTKDEFKQGHITGSVHVLPSDIKSGSVPSLEKYKASPITVICKTGTTAQESANLLAKAGYEQVFVLKGGLVSWSEAKMPLIRGKK